jgi:hypothetical protein
MREGRNKIAVHKNQKKIPKTATPTQFSFSLVESAVEGNIKKSKFS